MEQRGQIRRTRIHRHRDSKTFLFLPSLNLVKRSTKRHDYRLLVASQTLPLPQILNFKH